jgi:membrane-associated protease RseP (regulator of RpoE activity)
MLNETASNRDARPGLRSEPVGIEPQDNLHDVIQQMVAGVLDIEEATFVDDDQTMDELPAAMRSFGNLPTARFSGRLRLNSEAAYDQLDNEFRTVRHTPVFREEKGRHVVLALRGRIEPRPRAWWPNLLLFLLTLFSVLLVGTGLAIQEIAQTNPFRAAQIAQDLIGNLWRGLPYALAIMLILGSHELGHYFAARRHGLAVTLPYFIPLPIFSPFGTLGAFIQLRQPMRNRKVLLDVGAAGPLVGLVFAIPLLFIGLANARIAPITPGGYYEGDSLLYALAKIFTFGQFLPGDGVDVIINSSQLAWAGWTGLLVSALNLIPIGQLDGGHIMYALIGERARWLYYPLIAAMLLLVFVTNVWLLWVLLLLVFGRVYATPLDMITPLDKPRRRVGILAMIVFLLIFVPAPLTPNRVQPTRPAPANAVQSEPVNVLALMFSDQ